MSATISIPRLVSPAAEAAGPESGFIGQRLAMPRGTRMARQARRRFRHMATAVVGLVAIAAASWWVTNSPLFDVKSLRVTGNTHISRARVIALGGLRSGTNLFWLSPGQVAARIEANPWVVSASVSRTLPGSIAVSIRERTPVAVLSGGRTLVAGDGMVVGRGRAADELPRITPPRHGLVAGDRISGVYAPLAVVRQLPPSLRSLVGSVDSASDGIELRMRDGVKVMLGVSTDMALKAETVERMLAWSGTRGVRPDYIDVRAPQAPALMPAGAEPASLLPDPVVAVLPGKG